MGLIILFILLGTNTGLLIYRIITKSYQTEKKNLIGVGVFLLFLVLTVTGIISWSFRWYLLFFVLFVEALLCGWYLIRRKQQKEKLFTKKHAIIKTIGYCLLLMMAILPAIVFPQFKPIEVTGSHKVRTISYTLTDPQRIETFTDAGENRKLTIEFWYPSDKKEKYPLVVFSHGAFGFRGSNASTFKELASNGYVVCSIDHTYHSFFAKQTDGKVIIADMDFINDAMAAQNDTYDEKKTYEISREWLKLRTGDVNFVLEEIQKQTDTSASDLVYQLIDGDKIGLFGHSLGGAAAAEIGRDRKDIDAVIVIDGTMLGEEIGFENGQVVLDTTPYPIPILNLYNEAHYEEAQQYADRYANTVASANAVDARQVVIRKAGHLNFTDLPMFSPILASLLGKGEADSRYCIETMNQIILDYFNYYLKNAEDINLKPEY